jgi:hypothetical protein
VVTTRLLAVNAQSKLRPVNPCNTVSLGEVSGRYQGLPLKKLCSPFSINIARMTVLDSSLQSNSLRTILPFPSPHPMHFPPKLRGEEYNSVGDGTGDVDSLN